MSKISHMKFDVIIATYNRQKSLDTLVSQILECFLLPENIIIIDSSLEVNKSIQNYDRVKYIHSSHANQPYQRYLGYQVSDSDIIVYLDDDMEVLNKSWLNHVSKPFVDKSVVGVAINFKNDNIFLQNKLPKSKIDTLNRANGLKQFIKLLSGYPHLAPGLFWLCGIRGHQPKGGGVTLWVSGGAFAARREVLYKNFNFKIFDLFGRKAGMGEDAILGFTIAQHGKILFMTEEFFYHNDQKDSTYTEDLYDYGKRVAYSRLYLSFEYARLIKKSKFLAFVHFNWYMLWRLIGMGINQVIDYKPTRQEIIKGYLKGYFLATQESRHLAKYNDGDGWKREALHDIDS